MLFRKEKGASAPFFITLFSFFCLAGSASGEPYVPQDDAEVLETLPVQIANERELRLLQRRAAAGPSDLEATEAFVRKAIEEARATGDARYIGRAEAALAPWFTKGSPPASIYTLRAVVRQHGHDFRGALEDLDAALKLKPGSAQTLLTKASVHFVLGEIDKGEKCCLALVRTAPPFISGICLAEAASKSGKAAAAETAVRKLMLEYPQATPGEQIWALTLLGDILERLDRQDEAEKVYRAALELAPGDFHVLSSLSDILLRTQRGAEVIALLKGKESEDPLAVRLEAAYRQSGDQGESRKLAAELDTRFTDEISSGGAAHLREYSMLLLSTGGQNGKALELAQKNWAQQREPLDARLLVGAALASKEKSAAEPVKQWIAENQYEDIPLTQMLSKLQ